MDNKAAADQRRNKYKNKDAFQSEQVRNRRQKHTVELRKQKREENLSKRRNMNLGAAPMADSDDESGAIESPEVRIVVWGKASFAHRLLFNWIWDATASAVAYGARRGCEFG